MCKPKLSISIIVPSASIEYIAPFFRYLYFFTFSIFFTVICLTTIAPIPFPIRISGIASVKANAPNTPSTENVASMTSRYNILLMSDIPVLPSIIFSSILSAFSLNPCVMKNAVDPTTAPNAIIGLVFIEYHTMSVSSIETIA